jgi:hypothetical protein
MKNVICMKWGDRYGAEYVNKLYSMVKRNLTPPFRFICFTDNMQGIDQGIECHPMPGVYVPEKYDCSPWRKLGVFTKDLAELKGKVLFLDLDIIIIKNIDCFFDYTSKFCIIENWTQKGKNIGNSSVFLFEAGTYDYILDYYNQHTDEVLENFSNEQIFISAQIEKLKFWPEVWCRSFKRHCMDESFLGWLKKPEIPSGAKIVVFHGNPKPPEAAVGKSHKKWRILRSSPWINEYWK